MVTLFRKVWNSRLKYKFNMCENFNSITLKESKKNFISLGYYMDNNDGKIRGTQALENKLYSLESIALINNPRTENDKPKREKLIHFIKTLTGKGTFTKQDIETEFKSVSPVMVCSNEAILLVLKEFATITYDKRKKQYKVGKNSNSIVLIK
jgi:hypothetical protein